MRIIYKIKSSWDFISSQILNYLKRRWNSKMAISIKNHEDRITALEKWKTHNHIKISNDDTWYIDGKPNTDSSSSITIDDIFYIGFTWFTSSLDQSTVTFPKEFQYEPFITVIDNNSPLTPNEARIGWPTKRDCVFYANTSGSIMIAGLLKLYYNFSYNITREFYVVKFNKLRHYLCSHLRNYASNKGGVIQNGY